MDAIVERLRTDTAATEQGNDSVVGQSSVVAPHRRRPTNEPGTRAYGLTRIAVTRFLCEQAPTITGFRNEPCLAETAPPACRLGDDSEPRTRLPNAVIQGETVDDRCRTRKHSMDRVCPP